MSMSWSRDLKTWTYAGRISAGENACVVLDGDDYVLFHSPGNGIGVKRSNDLKEWRDEGVLTLGQADWPWAQGRLTAGFVLDLRQEPKLGEHVVFFHGSDFPENDPRGGFVNFASIGIAWSEDLKQWTWPGKTQESPAADAPSRSVAQRTRFLLLDSRNIESADNAKLTEGDVRKHENNPLFGEDKPWEKRFDNLYANVIFDQEDQRYKCWYSPFIVDLSAKGMTLQQRGQTGYRPPRDRDMAICYAVSKDGITWEKPELGLVDFEGSQQNNILWSEPHGAGVFKDDHDPDPARRYKAFFQGVNVAFSADGVHWGKAIPCPEIKVAGDTHNNALWAPTLNGAYPIFLDDEIRIYYGGSDGKHTGWRNGFFCLATLRPDGWAGYEPFGPNQPAIITTSEISFAGQALRLTADVAPGGSVKLSMVDRNGKPISSAKPVTETVTDGELQWSQKMSSGPMRLRFEISGAKLYSFSFATAASASVTPTAS